MTSCEDYNFNFEIFKHGNHLNDSTKELKDIRSKVLSQLADRLNMQYIDMYIAQWMQKNIKYTSGERDENSGDIVVYEKTLAAFLVQDIDTDINKITIQKIDGVSPGAVKVNNEKSYNIVCDNKVIFPTNPTNSAKFIKEYEAITCFLTEAIKNYQRQIMAESSVYNDDEYKIWFVNCLVMITKIKRVYEFINSGMTVASSVYLDDVYSDLGYSTLPQESTDTGIVQTGEGDDIVDEETQGTEGFMNMFMRFAGFEGFQNNNDTMEQCLLGYDENDKLNSQETNRQNIVSNYYKINEESEYISENTSNIKELQNQIEFMQRATRYTFFRKLGFYLLLTIVVCMMLYVMLR
jgi:hypothetical protein